MLSAKRGDAFVTKKCIHVKVKRDTFVSMKTMLYADGITVQDLVENLIEQLVSGDDDVSAAYDRFVSLKSKEKLDRVGSKKAPVVRYDELDNEAIYNLINSDASEAKRGGLK